jgi:hypothetical protein
MTGPMTPQAGDQGMSEIEERGLELTLAALQAERQRVLEKFDRRISEVRTAIERSGASAPPAEQPAAERPASRGRATAGRKQRRKQQPPES